MLDQGRVSVQVAQGVWRAQKRMESLPGQNIDVNSYLVVDDGESMLIDTAWWSDERTEHLTSLFDQAGVETSSLQRIFISHAHRDHFGFIDVLAVWADARPWFNTLESAVVAATANFQGFDQYEGLRQWYISHGVPFAIADSMASTQEDNKRIDASKVHWGAADDVLRVGSRQFQVIALPGHTPGHSGLFESETGILFGADALLPKGHGNPHVTCRPYTAPDPLTDYCEALMKVRGLNPRLCLPGHGPAVVDVDALIASHLSYVNKKTDLAAAVLDSIPRTAYEVARRLRWRGGTATFDDLIGDERFLALGDTIARLRRLVTLSAAVVEGTEIEQYSLAADNGVSVRIASP